ncbi:hypothetical protein P7K49_023622 [Saguinus oedipus]|uniref:Uncharacterized protein n=1 Tax=Saguinus oedipus TaxID=9490 RepID=A0ABQ9UM77_SAGOE|nr:hypothetical protein P7K49_023622 [Saguinus oedipus]
MFRYSQTLPTESGDDGILQHGLSPPPGSNQPPAAPGWRRFCGACSLQLHSSSFSSSTTSVVLVILLIITVGLLTPWTPSNPTFLRSCRGQANMQKVKKNTHRSYLPPPEWTDQKPCTPGKGQKPSGGCKSSSKQPRHVWCSVAHACVLQVEACARVSSPCSGCGTSTLAHYPGIPDGDRVDIMRVSSTADHLTLAVTRPVPVQPQQSQVSGSHIRSPPYSVSPAFFSRSPNPLLLVILLVTMGHLAPQQLGKRAELGSCNVQVNMLRVREKSSLKPPEGMEQNLVLQKEVGCPVVNAGPTHHSGKRVRYFLARSCLLNVGVCVQARGHPSIHRISSWAGCLIQHLGCAREDPKCRFPMGCSVCHFR